ncbi:MAG: class I SAM-dependent methyltransferase, partial [Nocardioides sp.]
GAVTRELVARLPAATEILATDLTTPMLDFAAERLRAPSVTWQQADAQALPVDDDGVDAVICQSGLMFYPDKALAHREAHRALKAGRTLLFTVWDGVEANDFAHLCQRTVERLFPDDPPLSCRGYHTGTTTPPSIATCARADSGLIPSRLSHTAATPRAPGTPPPRCAEARRGDTKSKNSNGPPASRYVR